MNKLKNLIIDFTIPIGMGFIIGKTVFDFYVDLFGTEWPPMMIVSATSILMCVLWAFVWAPIATWIRG